MKSLNVDGISVTTENSERRGLRNGVEKNVKR